MYAMNSAMRTAAMCASRDGDEPGLPEPEPARLDIRHFDDCDQRVRTDRHDVGADGQMHLAGDLASARGADERARLVRGMLSLVGFSELAYVTVRRDTHGEIDRLFFANGYRSAHLEPTWFEAGFHRRDVRLKAALASNAPFVWDLHSITDAWRHAGSPSSFRPAFDALRDCGACCGLMFGIQVPQTPLRAIVSFASPTLHADWITDGVIAQALVLGLSVHQRCSATVRSLDRGDAAKDLSDVQMRILGFLAAGLSDKEIALRMQTTSHNVDYHLRRLRQKCNVSSRTQLAFLAGQLLAS